MSRAEGGGDKRWGTGSSLLAESTLTVTVHGSTFAQEASYSGFLRFEATLQHHNDITPIFPPYTRPVE